MLMFTKKIAEFKRFILAFKSSALAFIRLWPDVFGLPLALLVFILSPFVLRSIDSSAGAYDIGILQILLFGAMAMLALNSLVWLGIKLNFQPLFTYYTTLFAFDFLTLKPLQKICVLLSVYFGLLFALVALLRVL